MCPNRGREWIMVEHAHANTLLLTGVTTHNSTIVSHFPWLQKLIKRRGRRGGKKLCHTHAHTNRHTH